MGKTAVNTVLDKIKRRFDYEITDPDLDSLVVDIMNDSLITMKQWFIDNDLFREISASASFKTIAEQRYRDITKAVIVGNVASFTAVAGDKITVSIDGTDYTTAALTGAVLVATVVTAINLATVAVGDVASEDANGYLQITSLTTGSASTVTISDNAGTGAARLFTVAAERTQDAITDLDEIIRVSERDNDRTIEGRSFYDLVGMYPDPTADMSTTPDVYARWLERIYFGPTPAEAVIIYLDYIKMITAIAKGDTLPFDSRFDPLLIAMGRLELVNWLDPTNTVMIASATVTRDNLKQELIVASAKNIGKNQQTKARGGVGFGPRKPDITPTTSQ